MQCERARNLLSAYIDGELEGDERRAVAAHIETCRSCAALVNDYRSIGAMVAGAGREPAPHGLALRVRENLARANRDELRKPEPKPIGWFDRWPSFRRSVLSHAGPALAASLVSVMATWWVLTAGTTSAELQREVLSAHVRALLQDNAVQVATSDQHTVKPWFAGRVDFSPDVKDLAGEGFPLVGGRLDYIGGRRVGALVYKRRLHTIDVFIWPEKGSSEAPPQLITLNGYNVLTWHQKDLAYWAISDINAGELRELQSLL
jgi:anti-sigma factor RsiW